MAIKVCIDAGHYGYYNPSPVVSGYYEAKMVWKLHLLQKKYLESYGIEVITTRSNQAVDRGLFDRGAAAAGCDLFLSIHSNACGTESVDRPVTIGTLNRGAEKLAKQLGQVIRDVMDTDDPAQYYTKANSSGTDWYGVLRGAAAVGVPGIIVEHSFHTNRRAALWLMEDTNLDALARAEAECIAAYYGLTQIETPDTDTPQTPDMPGELLEVDGSWRPATTRETQRFFDSIVDGVISGQPGDNRQYLYSAHTSTWEFIAEGHCIGSMVIRRLQHMVGAVEDGYCGYETVVKLQAYLIDKGYYTGEIDGSMGPLTVTAWQRYLNDH